MLGELRAGGAEPLFQPHANAAALPRLLRRMDLSRCRSPAGSSVLLVSLSHDRELMHDVLIFLINFQQEQFSHLTSRVGASGQPHVQPRSAL